MRPRRVLAAVVPTALALLAPLAVACTTTASINDVYMALDQDGNRRREGFFTDTDKLYCIAEGGFGRSGATVEMYLRQIRQYLPGEDDFGPADAYFSYVEFVPTPRTGGAPQRFVLELVPTNEKGEPDDEAPRQPGTFVCEVYLDGEKVRSVEFELQFAECPEITIVPDSPCLPVFRRGKECRQFGAKSGGPGSCECTTAGWKCSS